MNGGVTKRPQKDNTGVCIQAVCARTSKGNDVCFAYTTRLSKRAFSHQLTEAFRKNKRYHLLQTHKRLKRIINAVYYDKTQRANFGGKPPFQATEEQLNGEIEK